MNTAHARELRPVRNDVAICLIVTALVGVYLASVAWKGWIPFDDGMLAQTAQRVVEGQLPHRDFTDVYTGGLSFFHAAAFKIAGSSLGTLRATLLGTVVLTIPVWYYVASRFAQPLIAAVATLAAFAWSVPNYPAAMPSWYNLVLAILATAAMLRYLDRGGNHWVLIAGVAASLSVLVKIVGLYLVAALILFLVYPDRVPPARNPAGDAAKSRTASRLSLGIAAGLTVAPFLLIAASFDVRAAVELAAPPALMGAAVGWHIFATSRLGSIRSLRPLVTIWLLFAAGLVIPVVAYAGVYWRAGALTDLLRGVFIVPQQRFSSATMHTVGGPPLSAFAFTLPLVVALAMRPREQIGLRIAGIVLAGFAALTILSTMDHRVMVAVWLSVRMLMLPLATIMAWQAVKHGTEGETSARQHGAVLVCCVAAWCSLGQFPFSAPIYFSYVAPLVIFAATALAATRRRPSPTLGVPALLGYAAFALAVRPQLFPRRPELSPVAERIDLPRGGIYVWPSERRQYTELSELLHAHSLKPWILALPDVPEVYFLSGYRNPTRAIYDVFEDSTNRTSRLLKLADEHQVQAIVINRDPQVSKPVAGSINDSLVRRFPEHATVGAFEVRWK